MTSLQNLGGISRKAVIAVMIISTLALGVAAQRVDTQQGLRYGDPGFRGEPINLNVVNADIRDILNYVTEQYGINFVIDKSVQKVPVTVNVSNVPWNIALDSIMRSQELGIQVNGTILRVADAKMLASEGEVFRAQQNNALDSQPLVTEIIRLNYARAKDGLATGNVTAGTTTNASASPVLYPDSPTGGPNFEKASASTGSTDGILPIIRRRLSRRGAIEIDGRTNTLIITDVRENIDSIRQLVTLLDQPEPQVEIEARIVVATRNFSRDIGVQISALVLGNGTNPAGGVFQTGSVTGVPNTVPSANPTGLASQLVNTAIGLTTGIFGTARISALITAGEQKGQAKVIATPRVTTLNNVKAEIKSGSKIPISTIQPGSGGGFAVATTQYVDVPLSLIVTPQITDVGTVVLDVTAENSSIPIIAPGVAPQINSQSTKTQVTVPDGGTTVIGGVLSDDERESVDRTPGLSRIPLLGNIFKRKGVRRDTQEILFFITPRIYRPDFGNGSTERPKSTTIVQPVPLGNPASNSDVPVPVVTPNPYSPVLPNPGVPSATPKP